MGAVVVRSRLEFRVLGPLEVRRDGRPIALGGPRQRALLAALLIQANQTVSAATLIDELYGAEALQTPDNRLQVVVSRLRRALAGDPEQEPPVLLTQPAGYMLQVAPEQLDCAVFEQLIGRGRDALAMSRPKEAARLLDQAEALWRGPAFADLSLAEVTQVEIRRLDALRLEMRIDRLDADLMLGRHTELIPELETLVADHPAQERLLCQLMTALYRSGRQLDALAACARQKAVLRDQFGLEPGQDVRALERAILLHDPELASTSRAVADETTPLEICPYKGLSWYEAGDAAFFAGRETLVGDLVRRVADGPFVGVIGASGVGKSSTLRSGLLPELARGALPGSGGWHQCVIRPGPHPPRALAAALAEPADGTRRVVAVDQFEEAFTACRSEPERRRFVSRLVELAANGDAVIVAVRADYYGRCATYPEFARLLSGNHELVSPMSRAELMRAITVPAERAGIQVEPGLVEAMADDLADEPGGLPLLSTTLLELWGMRERGTLTLEAYRSLGGVQTAVARLAERAYAVLTEPQRRAARRLLLRLATTDGAMTLPRQAPLDELELAHDTDAQAALEVLTAFRLVTLGGDSAEVSHETLLHAWPRLERWLSEDRDGHRLHMEIAAAAGIWAAGGHSPEDLYRGPRLAASIDWVAAHASETNQLEREFVAAGQAESQREIERERFRNRRLSILLAVLAVLTIAAALAAIVAIAQRHTAQTEARTALARQLGEEAVVEPRIDRALLLAREAVSLDQSPQTDGALLATLVRSPAAIATFTVPISARPLVLGLSPDGRTLAVGDNLGNVRLFDTRTHRSESLLTAGDTTHAPLLFSASGTSVYAPGTDGLRVLDTQHGRLVRVLPWDGAIAAGISNGQATPLILAPASETMPMAVVGVAVTEPTVYLARWTAQGRPATPVRLAAGELVAATLADQGSRLVVATDRSVTTWVLPGMRRVASIGLEIPAESIGAISPDARRLIVGTASGAVSFTDVQTGRRTDGPIGHAGFVQNVAFSPDGRLAVSVGDDHQVLVWDPATATALQTLSGHAGRVTGIAFSRDGQTLYTSSLDGAIFEWDLGASRRFGRTFTAAGTPASAAGTAFTLAPALAASPSGTAFVTQLTGGRAGIFSADTADPSAPAVTVGGDVSVAAWDGPDVEIGTATGRIVTWANPLRSTVLRTVAALPAPISGVAAADDGRLVAAVSADSSGTHGQLLLVRGSAARRVTLPAGGEGVAISPDGSRLAVLVGATAEIRTVGDLALVRSLPLVGDGTTLAFSPSGVLTTGSFAGVVQRWDPATGRQIGVPAQVAAAPVSSIAIDPDGRTIATGGGSDGTATLWDLSTMQQIGSAFPAYPGHWESIAYTDGGRSLLVLDDDGHGRIWPTTLGAWEHHACAVAGRTLTRLEWARYVGGQPYRPVCAPQ
jgi:DNA-binding SARP family transcriptional activator/WD40 repeat protein